MTYDEVGALLSAKPLDARRQHEIVAELDAACLRDGVLQVMPAKFYASVPRNDLSLWCVRRGLYSLPTLELVDWLRPYVDDAAIEIGAGHGALGRALGLPITDSKQQEDPEARAFCDRLGQAPVTYPVDVEKLTAMQAIEKYKPRVVLACWVTHRYLPAQPQLGGNMHGVDESKLLKKPGVRRYILVGHERVHASKTILRAPHETHRLPFLVSRPTDPLDAVWIWETKR
jgi:hypothetical protein